MINVNIELPQFLDKGLSKPAQAIGNTITNTWDLVFGKFDMYVQKVNYQRQINFETFKTEIDKELSRVPEEKLVEPPLHILGPTLEASKYYFDNEKLRSMFAKLIASSINIDKADQVHPSFIEVIKQLSPIDAQNLANITDVRTGEKPIVNYLLEYNNGSYDITYRNVFLENEYPVYINASSITNLYRLGIINISYTQSMANLEAYIKFKNVSIYHELNKIVDNNPHLKKVKLEKGLVTLTPFGESFYFTCIAENI